MRNLEPRVQRLCERRQIELAKHRAIARMLPRKISDDLSRLVEMAPALHQERVDGGVQPPLGRRPIGAEDEAALREREQPIKGLLSRRITLDRVNDAPIDKADLTCDSIALEAKEPCAPVRREDLEQVEEAHLRELAAELNWLTRREAPRDGGVKDREELGHPARFYDRARAGVDRGDISKLAAPHHVDLGLFGPRMIFEQIDGEPDSAHIDRRVDEDQGRAKLNRRASALHPLIDRGDLIAARLERLGELKIAFVWRAAMRSPRSIKGWRSLARRS